MKDTAVTFGIVAVLIGVGVIACRFLKARTGGFRDWVKSLDFKQAAADYLTAR